MVGLGSRSGWRNWLGLGPSRAELSDRARREERDLLLEVLRGEREAAQRIQSDAAKTQQALLSAVSASSASISDYFKMVMTAPLPAVRVMDDATEVEFERAREAARKSRESFGFVETPSLDRPLPAPLMRPEDLTSMLAELRTSLTEDL